MNNNDKPVKLPPLDDNKIEDHIIIESQHHAAEVNRRRVDQVRRVGPGADYEPEQEKVW